MYRFRKVYTLNVTLLITKFYRSETCSRKVTSQIPQQQSHSTSKATLPTQQETLGQVVVEILSDGRNLNRKSLCTKLLSRLERAEGPEEEQHYHMLLGLLFER